MVTWFCNMDLCPPPTLLLTADEWREWYKKEYAETHVSMTFPSTKARTSATDLSDKVSATQKPYILFYYLNNGSNLCIKALYDFAKSRNLEVKYVSGNGHVDKYEKVYPTNDEFLKLLDEATYVVTDSFHGSVFSILFHKQFAAMSLQGARAGMNERLSSLFELAHTEPRLIENCDTEPNFSILDKEYNPYFDDNSGQLLLNALKK